jgi:uncharacterized protein YjiS (DUF1127 family)
MNGNDVHMTGVAMSLSPALRPCSPASSEGHGRSFAAQVAGFVENRVLAPLALHFERARLREELVALDHRELKDIGISDIDTFVAGWRRHD